MTAIPAPPTDDLSGAYRAVWRWHFYAGLLVLPVLMLMALTGALYLFNTEIDAAVYARFDRVTVAARHTSADAWVAAGERATGGVVTGLIVPERPVRAVRLAVELTDGGKRTVFVDPGNSRVTGVIGFGGVMDTVKRLHSLALLGPWGNYLVEIVAGWAVILVATGLFLWWPRKRPAHRTAAVVSMRTADMRRRPFWRDLHALTGLYAGGMIAFLAVTGMPWSAFWGDQYMGFVKAHGLGRPRPPAGDFVHAAHGQGPVGVGWTMDGMVMPMTPVAQPRLDTVMAAADRHGLSRPWSVSIPRDRSQAWTVARLVDRVEDTRALYVDPGDGAVKADIAYRQFGVGARAFEWGIAVHQGTQYGWLNRYLMLAACVAVWVLAISGSVMWWKRRPDIARGRIKAPVAPPGARVRAAVLGIVLPLAILYPLTGLSLVAAVLVDRLVVWVRKRIGSVLV